MCVDARAVRRGMIDELDAIKREIAEHGSDVTKECLQPLRARDGGRQQRPCLPRWAQARLRR
jgi:hypothetical protein